MLKWRLVTICFFCLVYDWVISTSPPISTTLASKDPKITPAESLIINETDLIKTNTLPQTTPTTVEPNPSEPDCPVLKPSMSSLSQDQLTTILTNPCRYDKLSKPPTEGPLPVYMQIDLTHIESADQLQFKAHMLVQYLYKDSRLRYKDVFPQRGDLIGEELLRSKIWVPHVMVRNERDARVMGIDGKDVFVLIKPTGDVVYSYRMTATFYCWMNLQKFPFDTQDCYLRWDSCKFGALLQQGWWYCILGTYNTTNLILHWDKNNPVKIAKNLHLTEFVLSGSLPQETVVPASFNNGAFVGNFSELVFKFTLKREVGYYVMDYFLPSILLVCTSWVTFWLQADASAPRVTLGTSTMLAFITLNGGINKNLPKVSYIKASEIWFLACACFIFCSMAEFAFVNVIWRRKKKVELKERSGKHILKGALTPSLARKQLRKAESVNSLYKTQSCTSLNGSENGSKESHNNYLTVHSFPASMKVPTITTQSNDDLIGGEDSVTTIPVPDTTRNKPQTQAWHTMTPHEVANWIDRKSRIVFPLGFLIFNIMYWTFVYIL
ncbi:cys-loop ligand-gated ion channel subunit isoform X1 [Tribolium castaneum]|uniref:cys-loop ligand-gated ion channel subunit isoform X1 n=1 Tax=Tribolium castaneum TaxID=7070 RepID=UPI0030FEE793